MIYSELKIVRAKTKNITFLDFVQCLADLISGTKSVHSAVLSSPMRLEIRLASLGIRSLNDYMIWKLALVLLVRS